MIRTKHYNTRSAINAVLCIPATAVLMAPHAAHAVAYSANVLSGSWTVNSTWNPNTGNPTNNNDTATINRAGGSAVSYNATRTIASIGIGGTQGNNSLTISGGSLTTTNAGGGTGNIQISNQAGNALTVSGGTLTVGNSLTNQRSLNLSGTGAISAATLTTAGANGLTSISGGVLNATTYNQNTGSSTSVTGGTVNLGTLTVSSSAGSNFNANNGTVTAVTVNNSNTLNVTGSASFSATTVNQSAGTLTLNHTSPTTTQVGALNITGGTLSLGANDTVSVSTDYNNSNFGSGNSFNARPANITGTGLINSSSATAATDQVVTGALVSNGGSANPTLTFGNVHVGEAVTSSYAIGNNAVSGPMLRGAIQVGGVDSKLSGSGVTAGDWNATAGASTPSRDVTLTVGSAGLYTVNQTVTLANNFDNVADQTLTIKNASGAAAYDYASASISPLNIGNVREGSAGTGALSVSNAAGPFRENLDAGFSGNNTGDVASANGTINGLAAGSTDNSSLVVGIDTGTAGAKSGTVEVNLVSNGSGTSGLGNAALAPQTVAVTGNVFRLATGGATPTPINFTPTHVGQTPTQALTITNTAANDGFSEKLNANFGANTGSATNNGGTVGLLATNDSPDSGSMAVGLDTSSAGAKTGSVTVNYFSDGTGTTNEGPTANGSQTISVSGSVYNYADADILKTGGAGTFTGGELNYTLDFGNVVQGSGGGVLTANLDILNDGNGNNAFTDALRGTWDLLGGLIGAFAASNLADITSDLLAGNTATGSWISFSTLNVGTFSDSIMFDPTSWNANIAPGSWNQLAITLTITGIVTSAGPGPQPAPEPATLWLFGSATLGLAASRRRRGVKP